MEADALARIPWGRIINQDTVKSLISNAVIEAYMGSTVNIN